MRIKNSYIISISVIAAIGGFLLGFDGSVISGAIPFYKPIFGLKDGSFLLGFSVSCIIWGSILGNLVAGPLSDKIGRKRSLIIAAILFSVTGLLCAFAQNIEMFIAGRIIGGLGVGIAILVAPIYIAEIAPAKKRGWLVSFNQLLIVIGLSVAYFTNYFILQIVKDPLINWRWMLGVEIIPAIVYFITLLFIPESPRWLIMHGKDSEAKKILIKVNEQAEGDKEYKEIKENVFSEKKEGLSVQVKYLFSKWMRPMLMIGFGLAILQQFSGINAILYYTPMVFESAGGERGAAFMQAIVLGVVFVIMTIVSMFLIDRLGRKPLLYMGVAIMALSLTITGIAFRNPQINATLVLISILAFIAGFSISLGPVMWALLSEIFPNRIRGFAISVVGAANALASFLVATFFPVQLAKFGNSNTYFIYAGFMFFCLWFIWKYVIETKGKSLEEIEKELIR